MLKPSFQPIHDGSRVRSVGQSDVVALEGFNKALGHPVALGALHRSRDWFKSQGSGKGSSITCDVARPVIREPLHFVGRSLPSAKPIFNSLHHQISNKISVDPFGRSHLGIKGSLVPTATGDPLNTPSSIGKVGWPQSQPVERPSTRSCPPRKSVLPTQASVPESIAFGAAPRL